MFYPVDSLRRGGRFYLCWVADSWPLRFATITHRQLCSQDIRKICDDLLEVMMNESGRPSHRFSLRLSSQLMRGLVRLYQRKVTIFLNEMCMIHASVTKHVKRKYNIHEESAVHRPPRPRAPVPELVLPQITLPEEPAEPRIEDIIQNSGNVVFNIQDITLKEATIPEFRLPPNDGFGEENPDEVILMLGDRTVEAMMVPTDAAAHLSAQNLAGLDITDKSRDVSRLAVDQQMERISDRDFTMYRKSTGLDLLPETEKEVPEIPEVLTPQKLIPQEPPMEQENLEMQEPISVPRPVAPAVRDEEIELEELEEESEPHTKRRRLRKLIIDKHIRISKSAMRARIDNVNVDLRCEVSKEDIVDIRVPCEVYMRRPCRAGAGIHSALGSEIKRLFMRNLGVVNRSPRAERLFQENIMHRQERTLIRSMLERIEEVGEPTNGRPQPEAERIEANVTVRKKTKSYSDINIADATIDNLPDLEIQKEGDIADSVTQRFETLSTTHKRSAPAAAQDDDTTPKRQRSFPYISFRNSQKEKQMAMEIPVVVVEPETEFSLQTQADKENVPDNLQKGRSRAKGTAERSVTAMLQDAGLADIQPQPEVEPPVLSQRKSGRNGSDSSETQLGSLDRTKVSLGDSVQTTDSMRFLRDQWGTEGTMSKILYFIRNKTCPVTVQTLTSKGPVLSGYRRFIAARCFTSILKLKRHGFVTLKKCPQTLEIEDIRLGPKFD